MKERRRSVRHRRSTVRSPTEPQNRKCCLHCSGDFVQRSGWFITCFVGADGRIAYEWINLNKYHGEMFGFGWRAIYIVLLHGGGGSPESGFAKRALSMNILVWVEGEGLCVAGYVHCQGERELGETWWWSSRWGVHGILGIQSNQGHSVQKELSVN